MRRIICFFTMVSLFLIPAGCSKGCRSSVFEDVSFDESFDDQSVFLLKNTTEVQEHIANLNLGALSPTAYDRLVSFDSAFFEDNSIVIIYHREYTGSSKLSVKKVQYTDNTVGVVLKRSVPTIVDTAVKDYIFIVEIPRNDQYTSAKCVVN